VPLFLTASIQKGLVLFDNRMQSKIIDDAVATGGDRAASAAQVEQVDTLDKQIKTAGYKVEDVK